ncbi:hypothetical protein OSTOST_15948 [Ostertagia ostertagi]
MAHKLRLFNSLSNPLFALQTTSNDLQCLDAVPFLWKESIVTAIPKSSDSVLLSSYRPISITPPPIKVLEKIVRDKILAWLNKNNSIPLEQHGFVTGASTVTELADCIFDWTLAINSGKSVDVISFDLSKAF